MGLITGLLTLPLAPVRGVAWISDRLVDAAEQERCDPAVLRGRLVDLNRAYEQGEIDLEGFEREEDLLLELLEPTPGATGRTAHPPSTSPSQGSQA